MFTVAATALALPIMAWAQPIDNGPTSKGRVAQPYAILLDNGEVLWGTATRSGDLVEVRTDRGSVLRLSYKRIAHVGRSLADLHAVQLKQLPVNQSRPAMKLAEWCLQHELTSEAAELLIRASRLPHDADRLETLQMRLQQVIIRKRFPQNGLVQRPSADSTQQEASSKAVVTSPVRLSSEAMEEFTSKIQPLVLNRCGNGGCHGRASECDLQLRQPLNRSFITKEVTQLNAAALASFIDYAAPANSDLLQRSATAHGGGRQRPLTTQQQARLANWVALTTGKFAAENAVVSTHPAQPPPPDLHAAATRTQFLEGAAGSTNDRNSDVDRPIESAASQAASSASFLDPIKPQQATIDPFDPSSYNQHYARTSPAVDSAIVDAFLT